MVLGRILKLGNWRNEGNYTISSLLDIGGEYVKKCTVDKTIHTLGRCKKTVLKTQAINV